MKNQLNDRTVKDDSMRKEYDFDYSKGTKAKYCRQASEENGYIKLLPEVHKVFKTTDSVNQALLAIINAIPIKQKGVFN
jgi:hypothetical protein